MHKKLLSVLQIFLIAVLALFIVFIFVINIMFLKDDASPSVFGYNVFMLSTKNMEPQIMSGAAVFASTEKTEILENGNVVLCYIGESKTKAVMRVRDSEVVDGMTYYTVSEDRDGSVRLSVSRQDIIARCIYSSDRVGGFIRFSKSTEGLLLFIVLPCLLLIVMQLINMRRTKREKQAININVPEFDGLDELPLFDNRKYPDKDVELDEKRRSIAGNFRQKNETLRPSEDLRTAKSATAGGISKISELEKSGRAKQISRSFDEVAIKQVEQELKTNSPKPILPELNTRKSTPAQTEPQPRRAMPARQDTAPLHGTVSGNTGVHMLPPAVANVPVISPEEERAPERKINIEHTAQVLPPAVASIKAEPQTEYTPPVRNNPPLPPAPVTVPEINIPERAVTDSSPVITAPRPMVEIPEPIITATQSLPPIIEPEPPLEILQEADSQLQQSKPASPAEHRKTVKKRRRSANSDIENLMKLIDDENI